MHSKTILTALFLLSMGSIIAGEKKTQPSMAPPKKEKEAMCKTPYREMNVGVRHNEARGVGYKKGYSTLEGFFTTDNWGDYALPFLDLRFHVFNDGKLAGNAGLGIRSLLTSINHYFGAYAYYDMRHVRGLTVNQVGPGLELLGKRMEYRINGYFPVARKKTKLGDPEFNEFEGHELIFKRKQKIALSGIDGEVGVHFLQKDSIWDLYGGATPYFLWRSDHSTAGGKLRLKGSYKQYLTLEATGTYDRFFKWTIQGSIAARYPFGPKPKRKGNSCSPGQNDDLLVARVTGSPYRFEIPMIKNKHKKSVAINPATGLPYTFWFVNNTSSSNGTFESPFPTLVQAQNASAINDVIYIFPGDGTTKGMDIGIMLKDNQKLFGAGTQQTLLTQAGTVTIPALASSMPLLTNVGNTFPFVVFLANNNEVSGLKVNPIDNGSSPGAISSSVFVTPIHSSSIHDNIVFSSGIHSGIVFEGSQGTLTGTFEIYNNTLISTNPTSFDGIFINTATENVVIKNNNVSGYNSGINMGVSVGSTPSGTICEIAQNTISNCPTAMRLTADSGGLYNIHDNSISSTLPGSAGIQIVNIGTPDGGCLIVENNQFSALGNSGSFTGVGVFNSIVANSNWKVQIQNNHVDLPANASTNGFLIFATATNAICLDMQNNTVIGNAPAEGFVIAPAGSTGVINVDSLQGNIGSMAPNVGTVNLVAPGTCNCP